MEEYDDVDKLVWTLDNEVSSKVPTGYFGAKQKGFCFSRIEKQSVFLENRKRRLLHTSTLTQKTRRCLVERP